MKKKKTKTKRQPEKKANIRHKPKKKVAGRPEVFRTGMAEQARLLCEKPLSLGELAKCLGVSVRTLQRWRQHHPELDKAIKEGREVIVDQIEASQFASALPHDETKIRSELRGRGKKAALKVTRCDVDKDVINQAAAANILRAYKPDKYGDKLKIGGDGDEPLKVTVTVKKTYKNEPDTKRD